MSSQTVWTSTFIGLQGGNEPAGLKSSQHLIERAGSQVYASKLFNVLDEGVAVLISPREARKYEDGGSGISPESFE